MPLPHTLLFDESVDLYGNELTIVVRLNLAKEVRSVQRPRDGEDVETALLSVFGLSDYLDIDVDVALESERDTQTLVLERLLEASKSEKKPECSKALFQLAHTRACGFEVPYKEDEALRYAVAAARKGYLPAQASVVAFHVALGRQHELDREEQIDWLLEATAWGSFTAAECLRQLDPSQMEEARTAFHEAGGYNQFFHAQEPPSCIHSAEFRGSISGRQDGLENLAQAAATYGDAPLLRKLVGDFGVDPNLTNEMGEPLLLLCCKAGHLKVSSSSRTSSWSFTIATELRKDPTDSACYYLGSRRVRSRYRTRRESSILTSLDHCFRRVGCNGSRQAPSSRSEQTHGKVVTRHAMEPPVHRSPREISTWKSTPLTLLYMRKAY